MLSKKQIQLIGSLKFKKFRVQYNLFIAEGVKIVSELLGSPLEIRLLFATKSAERIAYSAERKERSIEVCEITEKELKGISSLTTPNEVICAVKIPEYSLNLKEIMSSLNLVLDNINDPGNLGTIIRIADWFGIQNIICSENCVDVYNPKVVQATMGSIARIKVHYVDLVKFLKEVNENKKEIGGIKGIKEIKEFPVYGAVLNGENIYQKKMCKNGLIILGNETEGISDAIVAFVTDKISIPSFGRAESLNVAVAAAIVCSEFRRREYG
ncbi:MAG: RNA methyltransferase [Solirubrobacterales bacterium]|nr:RNA methyltransferase [Solirubrobacterales bacterium]